MPGHSKYTEQDIQNYINNKMSTAERREFDKLLKTNSELGEQVQFFKQIQNTFERRAVADNIKSSVAGLSIEPDFEALDILEKELQAPARVASNNIKSWILSGILIILVGFVVFQFFPQEESNKPLPEDKIEEILADYNEPFENLVSYDNEETTFLSSGLKAYDRFDYKEAIEFLALAKERESNPGAALYLGLSFYYDNQDSQAIETLKSFTKETDIYAEVASFYSALAYIRVGKTKEGEVLLKKLQADSLFGAQATSLLFEIEELRNKIK
jgi:hypothetical protein